jgi:hypothetical protein
MYTLASALAADFDEARRLGCTDLLLMTTNVVTRRVASRSALLEPLPETAIPHHGVNSITQSVWFGQASDVHPYPGGRTATRWASSLPLPPLIQ